MKHLSKILFAVAFFAAFSACNKVADLPIYGSGTAPVLSASVSSVAPLPSDSNKTVLTLSWTNPKHATDSANQKFVIEIDSSGRNFAKSTSRTVIGALTTSFIAKDLNSILLGYGFAYNTTYNMDIRVTSSYGNNNERLTSNTIKIGVTTYKIPPKVAIPTSGRLFLVGDASQGGWNNPVPVPTQEFAKIDSTTYMGVFDLIGGKQYLLLPVNGDWTHKFAVQDNTIPGLSAGGDFGFDQSSNFPGPATSGKYIIRVDFQSGKFSVVPFTGNLPTNLYIVGDATNGGWNNPVPVPSQQLVRENSSVFDLTLPLIGGKQYLLLPVNGDWTNKFAVSDNTIPGLASGGSFGYNLSSNFPGPATSGTYKITVNFATGKFTVN